MFADLSSKVNEFIWKILPNMSMALIVCVVALILVIWVFVFISVKFWKLCKNLEKNLVYHYDKIFYLWSQYYHSHKHIVGYNPWLIVLKSLVDSDNPDYLANRKLIKQTVLSIEEKVWTKVVLDNDWTRLSTMFARWKMRKFLLFVLQVAFVLVIVWLILVCLCISFG